MKLPRIYLNDVKKVGVLFLQIQQNMTSLDFVMYLK
jgi:hypothetical protein